MLCNQKQLILCYALKKKGKTTFFYLMVTWWGWTGSIDETAACWISQRIWFIKIQENKIVVDGQKVREITESKK